ncbi:hypothetical protein L6164_006092 [Bauhinia variegata]|uniref:Uncharacterized protein n=1 Tax=Bauhinia variegata TaxID=167791 RepID=A0ACB9PYR5_BAUVA|nr:hypothetical protein L6164_006092 [Bauhinia variegata]
MYYFAPSRGLKFSSRAEVARYLNNIQDKVNIKRVSENVVVEKVIAEGLPPGWIKKTRITNKGDTVRKDPFYIDPVSGYAFCSMKDVARYLKTGEIGRNAFKTKEKGINDMELEDEKFTSPSASKKQKLSVSRARQQVIMVQSSNLDGIVDDQQIPKPACAGDHCLDQKEGKVGSVESASYSADGVAPKKELPESPQTRCEAGKVQNHRGKHKNQKEMNLPRRASKRLAGIKADPVPEIKLRAPRVATKQSSEGEAIKNEDKLDGSLPDGAVKQLNSCEDRSETKCKFVNSTKTVESSKSGQKKHPYRNLSTQEKPEKALQELKSDKDQPCFSLHNQAALKEKIRDLENGDKFDLMLDDSLDLPLREIITDPCIAFAIQILTGITFDTSTSSQISTESNNINAAGEGHLKKMDIEKQGCNLSLPSENLAIPEECAGDAETHCKASEKSGSCSDMPVEVSWMDPCIEFAVKTLTGNIPLDYDANMQQDCRQQQFGSSNAQGHCEMGLYQADYYGSQYLGIQNTGFKQQSFAEPALGNARNFGVDNSAGPRMSQCGEDRKNGCQR